MRQHSSRKQQRQLCLLLLLVLLACCGRVIILEADATGDPVGSAAACGPGRTFRVQCYFNAGGYLADVVYRNTIPPIDIAVCNAPQQQLEQSVMTRLEVSASDSLVEMRVCADSHGVRGIAFHTALGEQLQCGLTMGKCTSLSSRGTHPLGGFTGSCAATRGSHQGHTTFTRVTALFNACWNTQAAVAAPACPPGAGSPGGNQACQSCPAGFYSAGGTSPCLPCPEGRTSTAPAQRSCGCFPGQGVYGPVNQDPDVCETCPAGTYAIGGTLSPCQPCSTDAFAYLTSAAGSTSIADCTCAAGFGSTDANPKVCSECPLNSFNEGPQPKATQGLSAVAQLGGSSSSLDAGRSAGAGSAGSTAWLHAEQQRQQELAAAALPAAASTDARVAVAAAAEPQQIADSWGYLRNSGVNPVFYEPTFSPCTPCGPACFTNSPGSTSATQCICERPKPSPPPRPPPSPPPPAPPSPPPPRPSPPPPTAAPPPPTAQPPPPTNRPPPPPPATQPPPPPPPSTLPNCVECDTDLLEVGLEAECLNGGSVSISEWTEVRFSTVPETSLRYATTPNILALPSDVVDCDLVKSNVNKPATLSVTLAAGTPAPTNCKMPSPFPFTIPDLVVDDDKAAGTGAGSPPAAPLVTVVPQPPAPPPPSSQPWDAPPESSQLDPPQDPAEGGSSIPQPPPVSWPPVTAARGRHSTLLPVRRPAVPSHPTQQPASAPVDRQPSPPDLDDDVSNDIDGLGVGDDVGSDDGLPGQLGGDLRLQQPALWRADPLDPISWRLQPPLNAGAAVSPPDEPQRPRSRPTVG